MVGLPNATGFERSRRRGADGSDARAPQEEQPEHDRRAPKTMSARACKIY